MAYKTQSPDTSPEMEKIYFDLLRRAGVAQRFERMEQWSDAAIEISRQAVARVHPDWSRQEILREWAKRNHGESIVRELKI